MTVDYCAKEQEADQKLKTIFEQVVTKYKNKPSVINNLKHAQEAWLQFRQASSLAAFPEDLDISIAGMCRCKMQLEYTEARIKDLSLWIEGMPEDACAGIRAGP